MFKGKVLNRYGIFYQIANKNIDNLGYAYLHRDLLDKVIRTTIILKVKTPYINMHEQYLQKTCLWRSIFLTLSQSPKGDFRKVTCMLLLQLRLTTIVSPIIVFDPKLVPMFFHMDSIKKFISSLQNSNFVIVVVIIVGVRGRVNNKGEKTYWLKMEKVNLTKMFLFLAKF